MTIKLIYFIFLLIINILTVISITQWNDHDISTLKLLQIIHRHGDRTPISFSPKDPFKDENYWPEGIGELTNIGKYRLWQLGINIQSWYKEFLVKNIHSPKNIYVRSSLQHRCIQSAAHLLAGIYPPGKSHIDLHDYKLIKMLLN